MTEADLVRGALAVLVRRACVDPSDGSPDAAGRVLAVFRADGVTGRRCDPSGCVLWRWLCVETGVAFVPIDDRRTPGPRALVTPCRVVVMGPHVPGSGRSRAVVDFCPAVRAGVALIDGWADTDLDAESAGRAA